MNERNIIETGVRRFLKELQKLGFFRNYVEEKLRHGDENLDYIIAQLIIAVEYDPLLIRETTEQIAKGLLLHFDQIKISFQWNGSMKGFNYWDNAWHLMRRYVKQKK